MGAPQFFNCKAFLAFGTFSHGRIKDPFSQAQYFGGKFDKFIRCDVFDGALEGKLNRRGELDAFAFALAAKIRQLLCFGRIDGQIVTAAVDSHDHALVDTLAVTDEQLAAFLSADEPDAAVMGRMAGNSDLKGKFINC